MEKLDNVIDALERCLDGDDACPGCYLNEYDGCRDKLNLDALDHLTVYRNFLRGCGERGELIRRSDLLKFPIRRDHCDQENGNPHFINGIETVMEYTEYIPAVEAEPVVHAHWIKHTVAGEDFFGSPILKVWACNCSACGMNGGEETPRCPHCGAHMDEEVAHE